MTRVLGRDLTLPPATDLSADLERLRVDALRRFGVLDTPAEEAFDELAGLAARLLRAPMALVSLVDLDRQWFKARVGFQESQTPRSESFCAHALGRDDVLVVQDAHLDPRFRDNPLVTGGPRIRFYAGAPLITSDGHRLGTLCVLDTAPRTPDPQDLRDLAVLSRQVVRLLELRDQAGRLATEVAARAVAEAERARNQHLLDEVLGNTDVLVYAKDLGGRFVLANTALRDMIGPVQGELLGQSDYDLFDVEDADTFRRNDALIAETGRRDLFTEELNHADGRLRIYRSTKFPLLDENGAVYAVAGVSTDVTELVAARSELKESQERWRALVEHSPVAVAVIAADGRFVYANPEALILYGVGERHDIEGRPAIEFVPAVDLADILRMFAEVLAGGPSLRSRRCGLRQPDGTVLTVEVNAVAVMYRGAPAVQVELRDVSTRVAAEDSLRASEQRFRSVFHDSPVAMALADEGGLWVDTNTAFGQLLGVDKAEMVGNAATRYAHPDDHDAIASAAQGQVDSSDGVLRTEMRFLRPDGEIRWAWASVTPVPGPGGRPWTLTIVQDVTARKAAENALRESEADLAAIAEVARCVQAGEDPRPVVVRSIRALSGASTVAMAELVDGEHLVVTAGDGDQTVGILPSLQEVSMTGQVWKTGEAVFLADAAEHPHIDPAILAVNGTVSALWQPVVVTGTVQALLVVTWSHRVADPGDRAVRAVRMIADEAAVSLQAKQLRTELETSARTDPLTGSMNRRAWDRRLAEMVSSISISGGSLTIALIDLDHFKDYNDTYGHGAGDLLLREFATAARKALRQCDVFARWGGEEFVIALPETTPGQSRVILERIRGCVPGVSTCSVGYTSWDPAEPIAAAMGRADAALYDAKQGGRDRSAVR